MDFTKDYSHFLVSDFASDDVFRAWILDNNAKAKAFWNYWLLENPEKKDIIEEAKNLLLAIQHNQIKISEKDIETAVSKILNNIKSNESSKKNKALKFHFFKTTQWISIAAAFLLLSWGTWFIIEKKNHSSNESAQLMAEGSRTSNGDPTLFKAFNNSENPQTLNLSDGSTIILESKSQLIYPAHFEGDVRSVSLEGSAFFSIAKNPAKPFLVHAQGVVTKVLGTSFKINAFDKNVKVTVKTGKVAIFKENSNKLIDSDKQAIVLTPNQEAVYQSDENRFEKSVQKSPSLLITDVKIKDLHFEEAPITSVLNALKEAYGIEIIFDEEVLKNCMITTSLTDEPLFEKLNIICKTMGLRYRSIDAKIVIEGRGCK